MEDTATTPGLPMASPHSSVYRRLKANVVVMDGANLHNSRVLEWHPGLMESSENDGNEDVTWGERHSWILREVLDFLCRSDSRLYGKRYCVSTVDYRKQLQLYQNPSNFLKRRHEVYVIEETIWFVVRSQYRFQVESLYNQMEDVCVHIINICMREISKETFVIGPHILYLALCEYHDRLFANYFKWCDYLGEKPFPWCHPPWLEDSFSSEDAAGDTPLTSVTVIETQERTTGCGQLFSPSLRQNAQKMMYEIALFKMLWGEAFNLRHAPEFLCWLFHWLCFAWNPTFVAEENFVDLIRDVLQRARDEQWYLASALRSPDHCSRLLYDDINEVFWERAAIRALKTAKQNSEPLQSVHEPSGECNEATDEPKPNFTPATSTGTKTEANDECFRLEVTRENLNSIVDHLLYGAEPGKGIKTFMERRTYLQVLRGFWRVLAWQCVSFAFLFYLRALIDDEPAEVLATCWNRAIFTAMAFHALGPFFDVLLANWRTLRKKHFWRFAVRENFINILRLGFITTALAIVFLEGLQSPLFSWSGIMGAAYATFYLAHGLHYYLYVRISGAMLFFQLLWGLPVISNLAKPATFTGNTPLLAEDFTHVVKYILFWIPVIALKLAYWMFLVLPKLVEAAKHIEVAAARPFLVGPVAMSFEENPFILRIVLWAPAFLLWVFDLQIFFILGGALYGSLAGCWRGVGFFKSIRKIQKRLLPVLSSAPLFEPESIYKSKKEPECRLDNTEVTVSPPRSNFLTARTCVMRLCCCVWPTRKGENRPPSAFFTAKKSNILTKPPVERAFSRANSSHTVYQNSFQKTSNLQRTSNKIQYQNCTDPYKNMIPLLRAKSLANRLLPGQSVDDTAMARKRFGFLWNEVVYSWRREDIISDAELGLLSFNELPLLDIPNDDWSVTRLDRKHTFIQWGKSTFRLPVYCYCDVVLSFLRKCELFHHQVENKIARFSSKKAAAAQFFREYVSDDPHHQDPRFEDSLHIEAGAEVAEALFLYLSRYFEKGVDLVDAIVDLWNWIKADGSRLLWISMISLIEVTVVVEHLFDTLQKAGTWGEREHQRLEKINLVLELRLSQLIELPTDDPAATECENLPDVIKEYLSNIKLCFSSLRTGAFPSIYPAPVDVEEVNSLIRYLQIVMTHTRQLTLAEDDIADEGRMMMPMTTEQMAEARCLHSLLSKADSNVFVRTGGPFGQGHPAEDPDARKQLGSIEHSVKLYFRRAARILRASNPFLVTPEANRRLKQFANSLLMKMPGSPEVHQMISMVTLTPYYREDTVLDVDDLEKPTEEGVSKMELIRSLHPQELEHFLERVDRDKSMFTIHQELENRVADSPLERKQAIKEVRRQMLQSGLLERYDRFSEALQEWASYRGQVLMRTVRGMMYHEQAIKMQAYLERMNYATLHLCHDLNRLDFDQLKVINSPEARLWEEVLSVPSAYDLCPIVKAMTTLKYQYIIAAQEFGQDIMAQHHRGRELTGEARSRLLRKLWMHKLLFRYPSLRVATMEPERDRSGVPTGYKVGKLYRLAPEPDRLRQSIVAPKPYVPRAPKYASTYRRQVKLDPADAAEMPKPHAKPPHLQFDPDDRSSVSETFTINTRSGGKSNGSASDKGAVVCSTRGGHEQRENIEQPGAECERHSSAADTMNKLKRGNPSDDSVLSRVAHHYESESAKDVVTQQQPMHPQSADDVWGAGCATVRADNSSGEDTDGDGRIDKEQTHSAPLTTSSRVKNFQADVATLIQKAHTRRLEEQQAAASMHRLVRRLTEKDSLNTLCHDDSRENDAFGGVRRSFRAQNAAAHSAARGSCSFTHRSSIGRVAGIPSDAIPKVATRATWQSQYGTSAAESFGRSQTQEMYLDHYEVAAEYSSDDESTKFCGQEEDAELTQLTSQHTRELARDRHSVAPWEITAFSNLLGTGTCEESRHKPTLGHQQTRFIDANHASSSSGAQACSYPGISTAHSGERLISSPQPLTNKCRRRHSIITLHPVNKARQWLSGREVHTGRQAAELGSSGRVSCQISSREWPRREYSKHKADTHLTRDYSSKWCGDHVGDVRCSRYFYMDGMHAIEPPRTFSHLQEERPGEGRSPEAVKQHLVSLDSQQQYNKSRSGVPAGRRSSLDERFRPGSPLGFAHRVAMFEEYFRKKRNSEFRHCIRKRSGKRRRVARRQGPLIWLSSRGPMRLQAVYTLRLPLVVDDNNQSWDKFPLIGPGKPENQNHAMVFTRMETLQVVDMNMEGYLEEALKLRNLLQEFVAHPRVRILGFREHIFTENVSSLASFMALQENVFTTTNQRFYHEPLQVRMHYGHPDVFDRFFVQTCGSCSKSSKQLHLSEDVFAGFNCAARGFSVRHVDYIQCGKGRDVGLQQVVMFERKVAGGNAEQMLSRDVCRMATNMDFFRLLSLYFSGPGFFFSAVILFLAAYVTLYVKCLFSFSQYRYKGVAESAIRYVVAPTTYIQFQLGFLLVLPLIFWLLAEKGLWTAISRLVDITLKFSIAYYNFMIGTKATIIDHVLIYGGIRYQETGRGFVIAHMSMKELWQLYYFTHFSVGLEMSFLLIVYARFCGFDAKVYLLDTWPLLIMAFSLLYVPFLFNPLGMYYPRLLEDINGWRQWMSSRDVRDDEASWFAWWRTEMEDMCNIAWHHQLILTVRLLRFLIISVGMVSCVAMTIKASDLDCVVYLFGTAGCSLFLIIFLDDLKLASPNWNRALSVIIFLAGASLTGWLLVTERITLSILTTSLAAFLVFSYGLLEITFVILGRWAVRNDVLAEAARAFHYLGGFFVFSVPVLLSVFTLSFHKIQTRILFNPRFVTIVKSGLVQRAEVAKKGHTQG